MDIYPAIDLYEGKAVRLYKGDYAQMTVFSNDPVSVAADFRRAGARRIHIVDLEGARTGGTPNIDTIAEIISSSGLFAQVGGGVRTMDTIERYLSLGVGRVILGTAAVTEKGFVRKAVEAFGDSIAVGADARDGLVSIKGWTESSGVTLDEFCAGLESSGVKTVICTDISRDGAMRGANVALYERLTGKYAMDFIASGGVSSIDDVRALLSGGVSGAIIGKAYYTGDIDLAQAVREAGA